MFKIALINILIVKVTELTDELLILILKYTKLINKLYKLIELC